jgi:hypothetical protein
VLDETTDRIKNTDTERKRGSARAEKEEVSLGEGKRPLDSGSASALERCCRASAPASPTSGRSEHEHDRHLAHRRERAIEKSMKTR